MCQLCDKKPVYEFTNKRKVCKACFIKWFEKKVLYTIRKFEMIQKGDIIYYKKRSNFREISLEEVLKMYSKKGFVNLARIKANLSSQNLLQMKKGNIKIALPETIDLESERVIHELIIGKASLLEDIKPVNGNFIRPLYLFLDKEVLLYAKLKGLKFKKFKERKKDKISLFIEELEEKHPEVKRAIVNSLLEINLTR